MDAANMRRLYKENGIYGIRHVHSGRMGLMGTSGCIRRRRALIAPPPDVIDKKFYM
ncbi:hypothetical protein KSX_47880 [Ktedonospora formicarum]|uniref:Uncharacterized protein n=1 Tax=Ktedonospora formicarum TaxID=2778364 RepID=A0A8J3MVL2_9CHLR|nr:hypothetical protein KSX_47880 [Ktedonospora formicarum]